MFQHVSWCFSDCPFGWQVLRLSQETAAEEESKRSSTRLRGAKRGSGGVSTRGSSTNKVRKGATAQNEIDCDAIDSSLEVISPTARERPAANGGSAGWSGWREGGGGGNAAGSGGQGGQTDADDVASLALLQDQFFETGVGYKAGGKW